MQDERLYTYDYRRPRLNNRTYESSGVINSMNYAKKQPSYPLSTYDQIYQGQHPSPAYNPIPKAQLSSIPSSPLSNYASKNLAFNERDVHAKNASNLDIITKEPKRYDQSIKQYPKLSLEDKDEFYYRRMMGLKKQNPENKSKQQLMRRQPSIQEKIHGRQSCSPVEKKIESLYQRGKKFQPNILNHADEIGHFL